MEPVDSLTLHLHNGYLLRDHRIEKGELWVVNGKIAPPQPSTDIEIDVEDLIVAPGFIDLQINGAFGYDFSQKPKAIKEVAKRLLQHGVTSFVPALVSLKQEQYFPLLKGLKSNIGPVDKGATILGIHLEGPFINPDKCGAHERLSICKDPLSSLEKFYGSLDGVIIVTLAPEIPKAAEAIEALRKRSIVVSLGHSNASYQQMEQAVNNGARLVTHLFNSMTPFHHRNPGIIGMALTHHNLFYSIIADKNHLHPATINLAWRSNPEGLLLISDAIEALGLSPGTYQLGNKVVDVHGDKALIQGTDTLAGSVISLDSAVRYFRQCTRCSAAQALEAASLKPAQVLGIQDQKGSLQIGADADLIFLDKDLNVQCCFIRGEKVWPLP